MIVISYWMAGCQLLVYPGAFNTTTGPAHWELLQRGRAVDNQVLLRIRAPSDWIQYWISFIGMKVYVATASPARISDASYTAWGHSTVVSPWGDVIATTECDENIVYADIGK